MTITQALANTILMLSFDEGVPVTPMKLQKLMFFVYSDYLRKYDEPLFPERFQTWKYGPVLASIYYEFNAFGANSITKFSRDAMGNVYTIKLYNNPVMDIVHSVWSRYRSLSAVELSALTHRPGSAWDNAVKAGRKYIEDEDIKNAHE